MHDIENIWDSVKTAEYLGCSRAKLELLVAGGKLIPYISIPRHRLFKRAVVEKFKKGWKK